MSGMRGHEEINSERKREREERNKENESVCMGEREREKERESVREMREWTEKKTEMVTILEKESLTQSIKERDRFNRTIYRVGEGKARVF